METEWVYIEWPNQIEVIELDKYKVLEIIEAKRNATELILTFTYQGQDFRLSSNDINIRQ